MPTWVWTPYNSSPGQYTSAHPLGGMPEQSCTVYESGVLIHVFWVVLISLVLNILKTQALSYDRLVLDNFLKLPVCAKASHLNKNRKSFCFESTHNADSHRHWVFCEQRPRARKAHDSSTAFQRLAGAATAPPQCLAWDRHFTSNCLPAQ